MYNVKLVPSEVMKSGIRAYWHIDFINLIYSINSAKTVDEVIFPQVLPASDNSNVSYFVLDEKGNEVLAHSISLKEKSIPTHCLRKLQAAIEKLHAWAEDVRVPQEKREFCRNFLLPDPKKDPTAYRLSGGLFSRKLHVLWGYQKDGTSAFLPSSSASKNWGDAQLRKNIYKECRRSSWSRIFRIRNIILLLLMGVLLYVGFFFPVKCFRHRCVVGKGVYYYLIMNPSCPMCCSSLNCNSNLDEERKCDGHKCKQCNRQLPISNDQSGICDDCFWELK